MAIHSELDIHLRKVVGVSGFTTSGVTATLPAGNLDHRRLEELLNVAQALKHTLTLVSGVLTVKPQ